MEAGVARFGLVWPVCLLCFEALSHKFSVVLDGDVIKLSHSEGALPLPFQIRSTADFVSRY